MAAPSTVGSNRTNEETAIEALKNMESLERNYIAIISPNTMSPMLHLKKYGECTLIDPRACIHHYLGAADLSCILYAHVSLRYFHYMVHSGYISNKTRVVLHCTKNDTYVFAQVENVKSATTATSASVDDIIGNIRRAQGQCRPGIDILQAGSDGQIGYIFTQPVNMWKKSKTNGVRTTTTKVLSRKEWMRRLKNEKDLHDCQRDLERQQRKMSLAISCRDPTKEEHTTYAVHVPVLVIEAPFDIKKPEQNK